MGGRKRGKILKRIKETSIEKGSPFLVPLTKCYVCGRSFIYESDLIRINVKEPCGYIKINVPICRACYTKAPNNPVLWREYVNLVQKLEELKERFDIEKEISTRLKLAKDIARISAKIEKIISLELMEERQQYFERKKQISY